MSNTIDQRVVEMRFDNKQFENGVSTTMSTLEKLKQKLNLTGASKGLDDIGRSAKNVNMNGLGSAVETVTAKFSALQVMGVTALANITNSAINAGKNIVKSLTIDPIMSGFSEYETKMGSIQTIMANTEHQGTTMDDVTRALDELNHYADKTIYNFQEMTRNIGTFTAAGVDLETSVRSIQGIANLAAVSGSTSQQASTAMYQLSQALATGTVKLQDWNSVVNAGMGGKVFQNALIRTAAVMDKAGEDVQEWQKENIDAYGSFRESLTRGEWLTSEVLTRTLEQFTMAAEEGSKEWEEFKKSLTASGYTEAQAEEILKMANTATDAATKVKTFTQLLDTLKESAQSGWAQTWELIVGDFEEAKAFFTELSDLFGGIIGKSADRRNGLFGDALSSNYDKLISKINEAGIETEQFEESLRNAVGDKKLDSLIEEFGSLENVIAKGKLSTDKIKEVLDGLSGVGDKAASGLSKIKDTLKFGSTGEEVKEVQQTLIDLGYNLKKYGADGVFKWETFLAVKEFQKANGILHDGIVGPKTLEALKKAAGTTNEVTKANKELAGTYDELLENMTKKSGRELLLESVMNIIKAIHRPLAAVGEAFRDVFSISSDQLYSGLEAINKFTDKFVMKGVLDSTSWSDLITNVEKLGVNGAMFVNKLGQTLKKHGVDIDELREKYGSIPEAFEKGAISIDHIKETLLNFDGVTEALINGGEAAEKIRKTFEGLFAILDIIATLTGGVLRVGLQIITEILGRFGLNILDVTAGLADGAIALRDWVDSILNVSGIVDFLMPGIESMVNGFKLLFEVIKNSQAFKNFVSYLQSLRDGFSQMVLDIPLLDSFKNLVKVLNELKTSFGSWLNTLLNSDKTAGDIIAGLVQGLMGGAGAVISAAMQLASDIISGICTILGIHSPSTVMTEVGENTVLGLSNGLNNGLNGLGTTVQGIGTKITQWFKDTFAKIREWIGNVDFSALFAVAVGGGMIFVIKSIGDALDTLAAPLEGLGEMFEDVGQGAKVFLKGLGSNLKASAWEKRGKAMIMFAGAIAILAASIYVLSSIDSGKLWGAVGAITVLAIVVGGLMFALSKLQSSAGEGGGITGFIKSLNFGAIAVALLGLAAVILAMSYVVKQLSTMNPKEAIGGFIGLTVMIGLIAGVFASFGALVKGKSAQNLDKVGGMFIKLSIALLLMLAVAKLAGKLNENEIAMGVKVAGAFVIFVGILTAISRIAGKSIGKIGGTMIKLSIALMLMVGVVKMVGKLTPEELVAGGDFLTAFLAFIAGLQLISAIPGGDLSKLGGSLLGISTAMVLLIVVAKLIARMEWGDLVKGTIGVLALSGIIAILVGIVKSAGNSAPKIAMTLLAMSVAIGILAGIAIMLSLVSVGGLVKGILAVGMLAVIMRLMITATRDATDCKGNLIVMTVAIGLMAAAVAALSLIKPDKLFGAVAALSILMGMFALMTKMSGNITSSVGTLIVLAGVVAMLAGILYLLSGLPIESTIAVAISLSGLLLAMTAALKILSTVHSINAGALISMGIMLVIVGLLGGLLYLLKDLPIESTLSTATSLSMLLLSMSAALGILALVGLAGPAAYAGIGALLVLIAGVGALIAGIGALAEKFPQLDSFLNTGIPILEKIGSALGSFFGNVVGGFAKGVTDGLPGIATNLSDFMTNLQPFIDGMNGMDDTFGTKVTSLVNAISTLAKAELWGTFTSWLPGSDDTLANFATQLETLGNGLNTFATTTAGITGESIAPVVDAATKLAGIKPPGDGLFDNDGIDNFGTDLETFGTSIKTFLENIPEIDSAVIDSLVKMTTDFAAITIPEDGWFGGDGIDNFGKDIATFGEKMAEFAASISETSVDTTVLASLITAAKDIAGLTIPDDGMFGGDGIDNFGKDIKTFGEKLVEYSGVVTEIDMGAVDSAADAVSKIINTISSTAGIDTSGVASFKSAVSELATVDLSGIADSFASASASMQAAGSSIINSLVIGMNSSKGLLSATVTGIIAELRNSIISQYEAFTDAGNGLARNLTTGIDEGKTLAETKGKTLASKAKSGAESGYDGMKSAGKDLGDGLVAGIASKEDAAYQAGYKLGQKAVQGEKDGQASASPSKETIKAGKWLGEGLVIGINRMGTAVYKSGYAMGKEAVNSISSSISKISDAINTDIDAQPTIRPVLDLNDVRAGAGAINDMLNANPIALMTNIGAVSTMMRQRSQNGAESEVVSAITKLRRDIANMPRESYNINGVTYDDGSNIKSFAEAVVHQARLERRV